MHITSSMALSQHLKTPLMPTLHTLRQRDALDRTFRNLQISPSLLLHIQDDQNCNMAVLIVNTVVSRIPTRSFKEDLAKSEGLSESLRLALVYPLAQPRCTLFSPRRIDPDQVLRSLVASLRDFDRHFNNPRERLPWNVLSYRESDDTLSTLVDRLDAAVAFCQRAPFFASWPANAVQQDEKLLVQLNAALSKIAAYNQEP